VRLLVWFCLRFRLLLPFLLYLRLRLLLLSLLYPRLRLLLSSLLYLRLRLLLSSLLYLRLRLLTSFLRTNMSRLTRFLWSGMSRRCKLAMPCRISKTILISYFIRLNPLLPQMAIFFHPGMRLPFASLSYFRPSLILVPRLIVPMLFAVPGAPV
jgi:hypothetical protein